MKTHRLNHRHNGEEKEICGGYLQPNVYIKQFNKNSPPKPQTYTHRKIEKRCGGYLISLIHKTIQ